MSVAVGTILGDTYELMRSVGKGGMGEVYEARHLRTGGRVAVKVLTAQVDPASTDFQRFRREAEIASGLAHPNIVKVTDWNRSPTGAPYLVMEFLDGRSLEQTLAQGGTLSPARVAGIVGQIASALAAAHGKGIVHRDLKPSNVILVSVPGEDRDLVKVLDFGISKVHTAPSLTGERILGTPEYMAPEQAEGASADIDGRTDEFALAAIAWHLLSGESAFAAETVPSTLYKVVHSEPPPLAGRRAGVTDAIEAVLRRALAKGRQDRFASIGEMATALAEAAGVPEAAPRLRVPSPGAATVQTPRSPAAPPPMAPHSAPPISPAARAVPPPAPGARARRVVLAATVATMVVALAVAASRRKAPREAPPAPPRARETITPPLPDTIAPPAADPLPKEAAPAPRDPVAAPAPPPLEAREPRRPPRGGQSARTKVGGETRPRGDRAASPPTPAPQPAQREQPSPRPRLEPLPAPPKQRPPLEPLRQGGKREPLESRGDGAK